MQAKRQNDLHIVNILTFEVKTLGKNI